MKYTLISSILITTLSTSAYASIKDKKAIRAANENIAAEVANVKKACGNSALEVSVNWEKYKTMITANKENLAKDNYRSEWVIGHSGQRTVATLEAMSKICSTDEDYKEEIAQLAKIQIIPKTDFKDSKSVFSLEEKVLTVKTGHKMTRSSSDFAKSIKALY